MKTTRETKRSDWVWDATLKVYRSKSSPCMIMDTLPKGKSFHILMGNHSKLHPRVTLNLKRLTLTINARYPYEIDLERLTSASQVLDFILQIAGKTWCDDSLLMEVIHAIEHACDRVFDNQAQGVLCPCGTRMTVDWRNKDVSELRQKISGAIKATIIAHGPITPELIGSVLKRIPI